MDLRQGENSVMRPNRLMMRLMVPGAVRLGDIMITVGHPRQTELISEASRGCLIEGGKALPAPSALGCLVRPRDSAASVSVRHGAASFWGGCRFVFAGMRSADVVSNAGR